MSKKPHTVGESAQRSVIPLSEWLMWFCSSPHGLGEGMMEEHLRGAEAAVRQMAKGCTVTVSGDQPGR